MTNRIATILLLAAAWLAPSIAQAAAYDIVIAGMGGEETYQKRFADWAGRIHAVLVDRLRHPEENIALLVENPEAVQPLAARTSQLEQIRETFKKLSTTMTADDELFVFLIGHGSFENKEAKFNIEGPDLTARELRDLLDQIPAGRVAIINGTSSSAGFINALSAPNRVICTATKSVDERNATEFIEYFIQGIEDNSADQNRDERVSVLEACQQAALLTHAAYIGEGIILTEHALIDDNADSLGTRLPINAQAQADAEAASAKKGAVAPPLDGRFAAEMYLKDFIFPDSVPRELIDQYRSALQAVEQLKAKKSELGAGDYYDQLEKLLLDAARLNRRIRGYSTS